MGNALLLRIAEAIYVTASRYNVSIGTLCIVDMSSEINEIVLEHIDELNYTDETSGDVFADLDDLEAPDQDFDHEAYDAGYKAGTELAQKSPMEIFSAVSDREQFLSDHPEIRNEDFDSGLRDALLHASN